MKKFRVCRNQGPYWFKVWWKDDNPNDGWVIVIGPIVFSYTLLEDENG